MSSRPPGWYPDASLPGRERWWDGGEWSHVTREAPGGTTPPPQHTPPHGPWGGGTGAGAGWPRQASVAPVREVTTPDGLPLANPLARLAARIVDGVVVGIATLAVTGPQFSTVVDGYRAFIDRQLASPQAALPFSDFLTPEVSSAMTRIGLVQLLIAGLYHTLFVAYRGATPGKLLAGVRVRPWDADAAPGLRSAFVRWAVGDLPTFALSLFWTLPDRAWLLWDRRRQCLHDKPAGTVVVAGRTPPPRPPHP